jgi:hypothetical protein
MKLNRNKIYQLKKAFGLTWAQIAEAGGLKFRQHAYDKCKRGSLPDSAEFFARIFNLDPKDLVE